jgi:hypothetical protein
MGIMWHCEPNMMRDIVIKSKSILLSLGEILILAENKVRKYAGDIKDLFKYKG